MQRIQLSETSGVPVFRQIIDQVVFMIEAGELRDGDRLPSSRLLATNLEVNRNTAARAYAELRRMGLATSQGRAGMVVTRSAEVRDAFADHEQAVALLSGPVRECLALGLDADEISRIARHEALAAQQAEVQVGFVECNDERAETFARDLSETVGAKVRPHVLGAFEPAELGDLDLVVTTFFHHAEVRRLVRSVEADPLPEVLAIVAAPHLRTLTRLSALPSDKRIGILYSTEHQAELIGQSLSDSGLTNVSVVRETSDEALAGFDVVVVPSEDPELNALVKDRSKVLEFGNVLDPASRRMVSDVVDDLRERRTREG
ncbi:GntR family transcriptional regulator [Nocardioides litoris]|uniref:GntR family transcriptional regulator n=1 Tax=Nocardioides litoris TaxID=1926648 RepID=UPI00111F3322|nr:GntR family transcriptional regulator [Nocardioides litoris]